MKIRSFKDKLFGNTDFISTERYFMAVTTLVSSIFLALLCVVHLLVGLGFEPVFIAGGTSLGLLGLYYLVKFKNIVFWPKLCLTILGLIMLDITWYSKYLSSGPVLFFILMFGALVIWVWEGRSLLYLLLFYFSNIVVLFYFDYHAPEELFMYSDAKVRSIDIFVSLFMYSIFLIFLLYVVKKEFLKQKEKAITSDKLKSAFLANMSHEIRTPMNGILGFMELLKIPSINVDTRKEYIEIIELSGQRMLNIINDIIDISKIESGQMKTQITLTDVNEMFNYIRTFFKPEMEGKAMKLYVKSKLRANEVRIKTDREKLYAIFINLVKNAIKYSDNGFIEIGCDVLPELNSIQFYVKDKGIGIAKEKQAEIFKHFVQADINNIMARQGAGLGLSITKAYVELLNGKIWLESELGKGSTFYFTLPANFIDVGNNGNEISFINESVSLN